MPSLIADKTTGLHLCIAVLGALYHRKCTGEGQMIEVPMLETLASFWLTEHLFGATWTPGARLDGLRPHHQQVPPSVPDQGRLHLRAALHRRALGRRSSSIVERPDLAKDPRFCDRTVRPKHFSELYQVLDSLMKHRTTQEWLDAFDKADIPAMPVRTLEELFDDPHLKATGFFTEREHPTEGPITTFASPLDFEKTKVEFRRHAPRIGGDGVEVLREAGLSDAEIEKLKADKALIVPSPMDRDGAAAYIPAAASGAYPARAGNLRAAADRRRGSIRPDRRGGRRGAAQRLADRRVLCRRLPLPDGRGALFDVLDRAAARGVDVRAAVLAAQSGEQRLRPHLLGHGGGARNAAARGSRLRIRWDRAAARLLPASEELADRCRPPSETAFVGGINLTSQAPSGATMPMSR